MNAPVSIVVSLAKKQAIVREVIAIGETVDVYLEDVAGFTAADIRLSVIRRGVECAFCNSFALDGVRFKDELSLMTNEMIAPFLLADGRETVEFNLVVRDTENDSLLVNRPIMIMNNPAAKTLVTPPTPVPDGAGFEIQFSEDGTSWHGTQTTDDEYWRWRFPDGEWGVGISLLPGQDGDDGVNAVLGVWKEAWAVGTEYDLNDAVEHNGSAWISLVAANLGNEPAPASVEWSLAVSKGDAGAKGDTGDTGDTGAKGDTGDAGAAGDMTNPMTAAGSLIKGGVSGAPAELAKGTEHRVLRQGATDPAWVDVGYLPSDVIEDTGNLTAAHFVKGVLKGNKATAHTTTIQTQANGEYGADASILLFNKGAGDWTIKGAVGVDVNETDAGEIVLAQFEAATLMKDANDVWLTTGSVA